MDNIILVLISLMFMALLGAFFCIIMAIYHGVKYNREQKAKDRKKIIKLLNWVIHDIDENQYYECVNELCLCTKSAFLELVLDNVTDEEIRS